MSTADLQFRQDHLLQIRLPAVKASTTLRRSTAATDHDRRQEEKNSIATAGEEDECSTPTSSEHKIPAVFSCPPAPKKQRYETTISCKRKLGSEFQFHDIVARDEIDEFFRSSFEAVNRNSRRRRQPL